MRPVKPLLALALALAFATSQAAVPFWGDPKSQPVGTPPTSLAQGQWVWQPAAAPAGPIVVVVALDEAWAQRDLQVCVRQGVELSGFASALVQHLRASA